MLAIVAQKNFGRKANVSVKKHEAAPFVSGGGPLKKYLTGGRMRWRRPIKGPRL